MNITNLNYDIVIRGPCRVEWCVDFLQEVKENARVIYYILKPPSASCLFLSLCIPQIKSLWRTFERKKP